MTRPTMSAAWTFPDASLEAHPECLAREIIKFGFSCTIAPLTEGLSFAFVARHRAGRGEGRHLRHPFLPEPSFRRPASKAGSRPSRLGLAGAIAIALSPLDRPCTAR